LQKGVNGIRFMEMWVISANFTKTINLSFLLATTLTWVTNFRWLRLATHI
jgi:hypothetical protein